MPLARLTVPVLPCAILAAGHVLEAARPAAALARVLIGLAGEVYACLVAGPAAARVGPKRLAVIAELAPSLAGARAIAGVDAGWIGAASPARIVDLAGVTDPAVAALPGGHTSKRIPPGMLAARDVDALVLLVTPGKTVASPWIDTRFRYWTDQWVAHQPQMATAFCPAAESRDPHYLVLRPCPERTGTDP
jgi:hypothetical protein